MAAASHASTTASTFGTVPDWPNLIHGVILALCKEVGGEPHLFDVVQYLNPEHEVHCRANPDKPYMKHVPVLKEGDCVTIGCNSVLHADSSQPPIS
eukprot:660848-Amphidinium_carterae.2